MKKILITILLSLSIHADTFNINIMKKDNMIHQDTRMDFKINKKVHTANWKSVSTINNKTPIIKIKITERPLYKKYPKYIHYKVLDKNKIQIKYYIDEENDCLYIQNIKNAFIENFTIEAQRTKETITNPNFK